MTYFRHVPHQLFTTLSDYLNYILEFQEESYAKCSFFFSHVEWGVMRLFYCFPVEGGTEIAALMSGIELGKTTQVLAFLWNYLVSILYYKR